jgi:hypothetical protein
LQEFSLHRRNLSACRTGTRRDSSGRLILTPINDRGRRPWPAKARATVPLHVRMCSSPVNPDQSSTSTTDTLSQWKPAGAQAGIAVGVVVVSLSAHALLHVSVLTSTVVAVALLRSQTLVPAALGALYGALIAVCGVVYMPLKGENPSDYFTRALANITNAMGSRALIPPGALTPATEEGNTGRHPAPESAVASVSVLPPATNAARTQDEPMYWRLVQEKVYAPGGRPDIVPQPADMPARGRHARLETDTTVTAGDPAEGQLIRAA